MIKIMVSVRQTIIAITTQNLNSNPQPKTPQIKQLKTAHARSIDRKNITRTVQQFTEVKLRKLLQIVISFVYQMVCNGILNEVSDNNMR